MKQRAKEGEPGCLRHGRLSSQRNSTPPMLDPKCCVLLKFLML
ncbi:hypothetical protein [Vallitalea okinawensis]|nr:hypothetical protein [Vallitalea okinawensis]